MHDSFRNIRYFEALRSELDGLLMQKIATPELNIAKRSGGALQVESN